jgi:4-hydroxybenzoate polyprenyltransferase
MKLIAAFFRLIRWPNLFFIILTQVLFYYCVYLPMSNNRASTQIQSIFFLLITASVLIAAAGYIINDYFDIQIDIINKPDRIVINKFIKRRWAIVWHLIFSSTGIIISLYIGFKTSEWLIALINFLCVFALLFYSSTFKRKLLTGNLIIAALTAWVILVVYLFVGANLFSLNGWVKNTNGVDVRRLFKFTSLYAGFAFVMTLIREVVKDLEDMEGDRKYYCNTMPIAWGVPATKVFAAVWIIVAAIALTIVQLYAWQSGRWFVAVYFLILIIVPLIYLLRKLYRASNSADYHLLSSVIKFIMLAGILSMLVLKYAV